MSNAMHIILFAILIINIIIIIVKNNKTLWHLRDDTRCSTHTLDTHTRLLRPGIFLIAFLAFWPSQRYQPENYHYCWKRFYDFVLYAFEVCAPKNMQLPFMLYMAGHL